MMVNETWCKCKKWQEKEGLVGTNKFIKWLPQRVSGDKRLEREFKNFRWETMTFDREGRPECMQ